MQYNITYREKDGGWQYIISYKTGSIKRWMQKSKQGFKTKRDAKRAADEALEKLKDDITRDNTLNGDYTDITLKELCDIHIKNITYTSSESTRKNLHYAIQTFKVLHDKKIQDITTEDIQKCINELYALNRKQSTIDSKLRYLKILLNSAVRYYKIIDHNPADNVKMRKVSESISRTALTDEEAENLLHDLKNTRYYIVALLALKTGMRIGEILGLTGDVLDFNLNCITVNKQFKLIDGDLNLWGLGNLKSNNSYRVIPTTKDTMNILWHYTEMNEPATDGRIFDFGNKKSFQTCMNRKIKDLGYDVCLHELRHTYATKLIASGVDFKTAAYLLGHKVEQTMNTYSHVTNDMLSSARNIINQNF